MDTMTPTGATMSDSDNVAKKILSVAQYILVIVFGLLPIFIIPSVVAPFGYSKTIFVIAGILVAVVLYSFSILRTGTIKGHIPMALVLLWATGASMLVAALLSGDFRDAFIGLAFEVHTALFVLLLALVATVWSVLGSDRYVVMRLYVFLAVSTLILALFHIFRFMFGTEFLSLGYLTNATDSLFGTWNDLAIFFGLIIILSLAALEQLPLTKLLKGLFAGAVFVSLIMLATINFFAVWIVLAVISLILVMYTLTKDRFSKAGSAPDAGVLSKSQFSSISLGLSIVVLAVSIVFIIGGAAVGGAVSNATGVSYLEVRPSFVATSDVVRNIYTDSAVFGIGPNKFVDAWRLYKDPAINGTIFWNTDFAAGIGYVPTMFATTGIVGGVLWAAFLILFVILGVRTFTKTVGVDRVWYFIGTSSFVAALFLWGMSVIYVPGPVLLLLAALFTGLVVAAHNALIKERVRTLNLATNRRAGFVLVAGVTVLIIASVTALYFVGNHYAAVYAFNNATNKILTGAASIDDVEAATARAFALSEDDRFARRIAEFQLARIANLLQVQNPTPEEQQRFSDAIANGRNAALLATERDNSDAQNWAVLGNIYASLVSGNVEGSYDLALEALNRSRELDPHNPVRVLALAQLEFANGDADRARELAGEAVRMKPDYGDAVFFLSQVDIVAGNVDAAIEAARTMTAIEPQNPVRFFQLGVLESSQQRDTAAAASFERAIALDNDYANARYFLAFVYDRLGRSVDAREQLEQVLVTNPGNETVIALIARLDGGLPLATPTAGDTGQPVGETESVTEDEDGTVTTDSDPDTPLISPVNTTGDSDESGDVEETTPEEDGGETPDDAS